MVKLIAILMGDNMDFEKSIKNLEDICSKMEDENITLDDGVKLYEQGVTIAKDCYSELSNIKGRVTVIKQDLDKFKEELLD